MDEEPTEPEGPAPISRMSRTSRFDMMEERLKGWERGGECTVSGVDQEGVESRGGGG